MSQSKNVVLKHLFNAKQENLFKAWTTPAMMSQWFDASCDDPGQVDVRDVKVDLRVGGKFEFKMGGVKPHSGEYREVRPYERLAFTWNSKAVTNTLVTLEFKPMGNQTELTLTHELLPADMIEAHTNGWGHILGNLAAVLKK